MKRLITLVACAASLLTAQAVEIKQMIVACEKTETLDGIVNLAVEGKFCKVSLVASETGNIELTGKLEAMAANDAYAIDVTRNGQDATITIGVPDDAFSSFVGELSLGIPTGRTVKVTNTSGYISVSGVTDSDVELFTSSGRVNIENFQGKMTATTKSSDIALKNATGEVSLISTKGSMTADNVSGTLSLDTDDGSVTVNNLSGTVNGKTIAGTQTYKDIAGTMNIKGSAGAIKISNAECVFNIKTLSSPVNFFESKGEFHVETTKGAVNGTKGVTLTASSDFTTTEGKINMRLTNKLEDLTFVLTAESSNASLIAKGTSKKKKLNLGKGAIVITGKTGTGSQIYG